MSILRQVGIPQKSFKKIINLLKIDQILWISSEACHQYWQYSLHNTCTTIIYVRKENNCDFVRVCRLLSPTAWLISSPSPWDRHVAGYKFDKQSKKRKALTSAEQFLKKHSRDTHIWQYSPQVGILKKLYRYILEP